ncbi:hypothetical protein BJ944DRAFT_244669, partial [Cunninghamella echinulata]
MSSPEQDIQQITVKSSSENNNSNNSSSDNNNNNNNNNNSNQDDYYLQAYERSTNDDIMEEYTEKPPPPKKKKLYKNKKYLIPCGIITVILIVVIVCLVIFVFFPMIAQFLINQAGIDVNKAQIGFDQQQQQHTKREEPVDIQKVFYMNMESALKNTGPFNANIHFHNPIEVYYNDTLLGTVTLPDTGIGGGRGSLQANTPFLIQDTNFFANFAKDMLASDMFEWNLRGKCDVTALGITATVNLDKKVSIPGMGGFKEVKITKFLLPSDNPSGGMNVELETLLKSPSPIEVKLGTITLQIGYEGVNLGQVTAETITLKQGDNTINLKGIIKPLNSTADLEKVGQMFTTYVSGGTAKTTALGISAAPDGKTQIGWLTKGFQSVVLNVGLANEGGPLKIINAVSMGYLDLKFDTTNPYAPTVSAPNVVADYHIPFGI